MLLFTCAGFFACKQGTEVTSLAVTIRLPNEPDNLHPIFSQSIYAAQIESIILLPMAEYDPETMELSPLLIERIPVPENIADDRFPGCKLYRIEFRPEAVWSDGKPVTGEDYLFTCKSVHVPHYNAGAWRSQLSFIQGIEPDPADPKRVVVYIDSAYFLALEPLTNWNLYPAHIYDPENILSRFTLADLRNKETVWTAEQDSLLKRFATLYESAKFFRDKVTGSGAYELDEWVTGEYIRLKRKQPWWGDAISDPPALLRAYPSEITYRIILEAASAEAALKAGEIDLTAEVPASGFKRLQEDPAWKDKLQFATPAVMQVNYIEVNNRKPALADPKIRQALAYTVDYDGMLTHVLQGYASRTTGPIHPFKSYYNDTLVPIGQDINRSIALIREAGWADSNNNGIPDKVINGKKEELEFSIKVTNKEEGMAIANIVKDNAAKAGIRINIDIVEPGQLQQDARQRNFDLMPLRVQAFPSPDDPFVLWHSSNDRSGGTNRSGFRSAELDKVIEELRSTGNTEMRDRLYGEFQEILYEQQPAIYLYVPYERIVASKRIRLVTSPRRPGYFENLIRPAGS